MHGRAERRFVPQLIAQPTIEAFYEGILLRLAGHNVDMHPGYGRLVWRSQRAQKCIQIASNLAPSVVL
jgi:hypothetical protein